MSSRIKFLIPLAAIIVICGLIYIAMNPTPPSNTIVPTENNVTQASLTSDEERQILAASDQLVKTNTEAGYTYTLAIKKHVGEYVRVDVTPGAGEMIDPAQVILEKKNGVWEAITFGTSFPELYDKVPELFE